VKLILVIMLTLFGTATFAGDAGCGLGSIIIQKNSKGLQLLAWTTNGTFLSQPLGITSGTSGCSSSGLVKNDKQIEYFVEVNQDDLSREMAQGQGEKLNVLAQLNGCASPEAQAAFAGMTQVSYEKIIPTSDTLAQDFVQNLKVQMAQDSKLAGLCQVASR
jgi:hypothetical protein